MKRFLTILLLCLSLSYTYPLVVASSISVDDTSFITNVIDGDTFDTSKTWRIRLADIDAPEFGETGYADAKLFLESLVLDQEVYLDVDPQMDPYDRYVCLAYVQYNITHVKNVNLALVLGGYAVVQNYTNNQFDPDDWTLYVAYSPVYSVYVQDYGMYNVTILSNSTISEFTFSQAQKQLSFNVTGLNRGYCNITIPKEFLSEDLTVFLNDVVTSHTLLEDDANSYVYFMYAHSTHSVKIVGTTVIPEFPTMMSLILLLMIASLMLFFVAPQRKRM